jgi:hypothetical protein
MVALTLKFAALNQQNQGEPVHIKKGLDALTAIDVTAHVFRPRAKYKT